ncbi:hypothetical protein [Methylovulum miyakonense]|uniref:hypothetical protein n=1 Tax=Methylovulum miyakonense TaxID=645578 RepID=UPI003BB66D6E
MQAAPCRNVGQYKMELLGKNWSVDLKIAFNAYLLSVTYASLSFTLLLECFTIISGGGFESATSNDFFTKAQHLLGRVDIY